MPRDVSTDRIARGQHTISGTDNGGKFGLAVGTSARAYLHELAPAGSRVGWEMWIDATSHKTNVSSTAAAEAFLTGNGWTLA